MLSPNRTTPTGDRIAPHIADALRSQIDDDVTITLNLLEINSGYGQQAAYLAPLFRNVIIQPTDSDPLKMSSIQAYASTCRSKNMLQPLLVNVCEDMAKWPAELPRGFYDYMLNINMMHFEPWGCSVGLFKAAKVLLKLCGKLFTYGPYAQGRTLHPKSIEAFDESLRVRNPEWGIRNLKELEKFASGFGFQLKRKLNTPGNTALLIWVKIQ